MIVLCGFPISNYYNKVKLALLEKGIAFSEEGVGTGSTDPAVLAASPLAKIPFIRTDARHRCARARRSSNTSRTRYPEPALLPADPFAAAKVRELVTFIDLHVELVARELYPKAFFGGTISDGNAERVRKLLVGNIAALKQLARFAPYIAGPRVHAGRLRRLADAAGRVDGDQAGLRRRPARRRRASTGSRTSASSASGRARSASPRIARPGRIVPPRARAEAPARRVAGGRRRALDPQAGWLPGSGGATTAVAAAAAAAAIRAVTSLR